MRSFTLITIHLVVISIVSAKIAQTPYQTYQSSSCKNHHQFTEAGQSKVILSPNYPEEYFNNMHENTCFLSPPGTTMHVACNEFNVEREDWCKYDYLGVSLSGNPNSIDNKYCGSVPSRSPESIRNKLAVVFKSDYANYPMQVGRAPYRYSCTVKVSGNPTPPRPSTTPPPPIEEEKCKCGHRNAQLTRIVGGSDAGENEFPWRCYMQTKRHKIYCGCSIISDRWILTAAHCTKSILHAEPMSDLAVIVGDHNIDDSIGHRYLVEDVIDHPDYGRNRTLDADISLIKLETPIAFSDTVSPVCLPFKYSEDDFDEELVSSSGWGATSDSDKVRPSILKKIDGLTALSTEHCKTFYHTSTISDNMMCAMKPGEGICYGDSGGSIDLERNGRHYAVGVNSFLILECGSSEHPSVFAKVTNFLDWIQTTTDENFCRE